MDDINPLINDITPSSNVLSKVLVLLRSLVESAPHNRSFMVGVIASRMQMPEDAIYEACWQLVASGLIAPGEKPSPATDRRLMNCSFPHFFVTEFGIQFLANIRDDEFAVLDPLRYRNSLLLHYPGATLTLSNYAHEAAASYRSRHFLAATVLIGVAAEELLGNLYETLADHADREGPSRPGEIAVLRNREKGSMQRFETFRKVFDRHKNGMDDKSLTTISLFIYDSLFKIMKTSRDDVAHGRGHRISRDIALNSLTSFVVATECVNQLEEELRMHTCVL